MSRLLRRHGKVLASTVAGFWAFAVFAGIATACIRDVATSIPPAPVTAVHAAGGALDHGTAPDCGEHFGNQGPLPAPVRPAQEQEQPAGQPLADATHHDPGYPPLSAPALRSARTAHPSPGVPFSLRIVRLAL